MRFDIITIFPRILDSYFNESILKRAQKNKLIEIKTHNLRDFTKDKHNTVDDKPYGGGPGMVFKVEPLYKAIKAITKSSRPSPAYRRGRGSNNKKLQPTSYNLQTKVVLLSPAGKKFDQKTAQRYAKLDQLIFVCGRYEGVDARIEKFIDEKISIGDYVLSGGELPAAVMIEAISRNIKGVLGKNESLAEETHNEGIKKEYPHYTRPEIIKIGRKKFSVPKVLLSGDHKKISEWRKKHQS